jgi:hypothetical protein
MYAVHGILNPHQAVIFSRSITARVAWTKPDPPLSWLWTLTDLAKSKSELVAENALLRKPLIILRRRVLQPAWTKTDTMILGLLAKGQEPGNKTRSLSGQKKLLLWYGLNLIPVLCCRCGTGAVQR